MTRSSADDSPPVWHPGEVELQRQAGSARRLDQLGAQIVRDHLIQQHRDFFASLPFVVIGAVDGQDRVWATIRTGPPGFLNSPDASRLHVSIRTDVQDPANSGLGAGRAIAMLGIDLGSRRRSRLNGTIRNLTTTTLDVQVLQSFGNCPQYIHPRQLVFIRDPATPSISPAMTLDHLQGRGLEIVRNADTFFVASFVDLEHGGRQVDVSHRGGPSGFVQVGARGVLTIPDYRGNNFFNTLGNFLSNPKAGLLFVDFATGDLVQTSGDVELRTEPGELEAFPNAERLWRFKPRSVVYRSAAIPLQIR